MEKIDIQQKTASIKAQLTVYFAFGINNRSGKS